jgi:hypothetical protein
VQATCNHWVLSPIRKPVCASHAPEERLKKLTAGERNLFLLLGSASNQINATGACSTHSSLFLIMWSFTGWQTPRAKTDVNEAHRRLLGDIAPIALDLSTFAFGFAEAIFIKYFGGELTER